MPHLTRKSGCHKIKCNSKPIKTKKKGENNVTGKIVRKFLCIMLVAGMVCSGVSGSVIRAAKKASLKVKKLSMVVG